MKDPEDWTRCGVVIRKGARGEDYTTVVASARKSVLSERTAVKIDWPIGVAAPGQPPPTKRSELLLPPKKKKSMFERLLQEAKGVKSPILRLANQVVFTWRADGALITIKKGNLDRIEEFDLVPEELWPRLILRCESKEEIGPLVDRWKVGSPAFGRLFLPIEMVELLEQHHERVMGCIVSVAEEKLSDRQISLMRRCKVILLELPFHRRLFDGKTGNRWRCMLGARLEEISNARLRRRVAPFGDPKALGYFKEVLSQPGFRVLKVHFGKIPNGHKKRPQAR